ncbi:MAG: 23S rRNA (adenine(2503)-C(2))-methyltransferase [Rickettsiales bacterium TMED251]|nr:MAG: 23S rRNA (adenine(2503)-C(2))-methyltransferase [Rickettsiales bacterium TMED251]
MWVTVLKRNIYDLNKSELEIFLTKNGYKKFRIKQIWNWLYVQGVCGFEDMKNISKELKQFLEENFFISRFKVKKYMKSIDGTIKWVFLLSDGKEIETVFIPDGKRGTICLSSQVGCTLSCSFCHTGTMKFARNLNLAEILSQVLYVKHDLFDWQKRTEEKRITNIVFMGMGEPLFNYENVIKSVNILSDPEGLALSKRKITLSTSGVVPRLVDFKYEKDINLAISLHAVFDKLRNTLVPINKKWPLEKLINVLKEYNSYRENKRITFEYIMLKDVNDSLEDAKELIKLIKNLNSKVNLIPFNKWPGSKYEVSPNEKIEDFKNYVMNHGNIIATIRKPRGEDILAACGQLKSSF